ncbi:hypothetical protein HUT19_34860 [Streptomyces sp. NA02950]|uniref:hypothetical protein n=1 Tax=Streptomyces sp. NA02950 TaxID=2742137 RepID=UPI001591AF22|nr:hypothetical protein [Streptomyces sp. NA02950]QKV96266.1 hypothetical protein HUT19_34860 [Streptomyces sp. NA02950]
MARPRHPLTLLRALTADTQLSYAELVADTHEALGFGKLQRRREKVSRWETQGIPPDRSTQLVIAHIHQVPEEEVQRLGWPHWLHLGKPAAPRATRTGLREERGGGAGGARADAKRSDGYHGRSRLAVSGTALVSFVRETLAMVSMAPPPPPVPACIHAHNVTPETAALLEERAASLYSLVSAINPVALHRVARAEFELARTLVTDSGYDLVTGSRLLLVVARLGHLCGVVSKGTGDDARAARYYLAAVRAAARAGDSLMTAVCLADLAWCHADAGDPDDVLSLVRAARSLAPEPPPSLAVVLHSREARAHARCGELIASARALDRTTGLLARSTDGGAAPYQNVGDAWLSIATARAWLDAGQPKRALEHFAPLLSGVRRTPPRGGGDPEQPPLLVARDLLSVADAQLALRDVDAAVDSARRAVSQFDRVPTGILGRCRRAFASHADTPAVRDLTDFLAETPAPAA